MIEAQVFSGIVVVGIGRICLAKTGEPNGEAERQAKANATGDGTSTHTSPSAHCLPSHSLSIPPKKISSTLRFAFPPPPPDSLLYVVITASPSEWRFLLCQQFFLAPAVPPRSGCFIQKNTSRSNPPSLTPVCFHSTSVSKLSPTS